MVVEGGVKNPGKGTEGVTGKVPSGGKSGRVGKLGSKGVERSGGNCGKVGVVVDGKGSGLPEKSGACWRWRAAEDLCMPEKTKAMKMEIMKSFEVAIVNWKLESWGFVVELGRFKCFWW